MIKPTMIFQSLLVCILSALTVGCLKTYTCSCETVVVDNADLKVTSKEEFRIKVEALNKADAENACSETRSSIATANETTLTDCGLR